MTRKTSNSSFGRVQTGVAVIGMVAIGMASFNTRAATPYRPPEQDRSQASVFLSDRIERPLRYTPVGTDFVITNGGEFFNRSLYGGSSPFRVDAGEVPEFSLYLPGRGGNLRLGLRVGGQSRWLHEVQEVVARYRPGSMVYEIRDPLLGRGRLEIVALCTRADEGLIVRLEYVGDSGGPELLFAFGGVNGMRGRRDGDIGCEVEPVSQFFQLRPDQCVSNIVALDRNAFLIRGRPGVVGGVVPVGSTLAVGEAEHWAQAGALFATSNPGTLQPLVIGRLQLKPGQANYLGFQRLAGADKADELLASHRQAAGATGSDGNSINGPQWRVADLPALFAQEEATRRVLVNRVVVETPDPFINAAVASLNVAADAVWDDRQDAYLHGGVAWRVRLLGWRVSHAGDALGWHDRTAGHFEGFARQQNTNVVPAMIPAPEEDSNLARNETALHSNGNMTRGHYDMNLVGVDAFFRHLLWTGDLDYARRMWPAIERHLAWERRLFRREFGVARLPLYEAYCCIWASDDLAYNGGGATHSSAYNLYHNRMAARVAKLLGRDSALYEREAELIAKGMRENLWLADRGWFAEWKDLLGLQLVHPNAAAWTFYHTVDSKAASPLEAWQMTRFVDTQLPRFPVGGTGVPAGGYTMSTTTWMPYTWSLNNVVLAETMHTALAYWQANRPEGAFPLFKGAVLDSMFLGLCPGNVGMCTYFDAVRRESQRDFGDGVGAMSRALIEGLFGVQPDLLENEVRVRPGFPAEWDRASLRHPDFQLNFQRDGDRETYGFKSSFGKPLKLRLEAVAWRDEVAEVTVNGKPVPARVLTESVGSPRIAIDAAPSGEQEIVFKWRGNIPARMPAPATVLPVMHMRADAGAKVLEVVDPQRALSEVTFEGSSIRGSATGTPGHRTIFAQVQQGDLRWWQPIAFEIRADPEPGAWLDWAQPLTSKLEPVDLSAVFNDRVTQIFKNEYRLPRSPFCSLAMPKQGFGSWCHPKDIFEVDDSGLRGAAARSGGRIVLPNGVPLLTPGVADARNIAFVSQWENYPDQITVPLDGKASRVFLLMAGSTDAMKSRFDNGEVVVTFSDSSTARLALHNPTTWWPIDQDYYIDNFAFRRPEPLPVRVDLKTGQVRVLQMETFKGQGRVVPGGAATVLNMTLNPAKELKSITVRALANEIVIGLMSVTLER